MIKDDEGLVIFVTALESKAMVQSVSDHVGRIEYRISLKTVEDFVPVNSIEPRLRAIASAPLFDELTPERKRAIRTFIDTVDGKVNNW